MNIKSLIIALLYPRHTRSDNEKDEPDSEIPVAQSAATRFPPYDNPPIAFPEILSLNFRRNSR